MKQLISDYTITEHILKKAVVLVDTREKENTHIIEYLTKKNIAFIETKMPFGDYGMMIPKNAEYGFAQDMVIEYAVERKASLEELSGNFTADRDRIENELWRGCGKIDFVIENGSLDKIIKGQYNTQYDKRSFIGTIITFKNRYDVGFNFVDKENSAELIYKLLYYRLRKEVKGE